MQSTDQAEAPKRTGRTWAELTKGLRVAPAAIRATVIERIETRGLSVTAKAFGLSRLALATLAAGGHVNAGTCALVERALEGGA